MRNNELKMSVKETVIDKEFIEAMEVYRTPDKTVGLIEACSKSVIIFADYMLGLKLYSWQVQFLNEIQVEMPKNEGKREFVSITSRQIGKSTALAVFSLWCSMFNKYKGTVSNNTSVGIASASDVQAKKLLYEMKKFIRLGDRHMEISYKDEDGNTQFGSNFFSSLLDDNEPNNTTTITFKPHNDEIHGEFLLACSKSGSTIKSYPATSTVLGETFSVVIIDEAGKTDRISDQFFYDYMYPTGNSTNAVRIYTSTPWVSSGFFYRMVDPDDVYGDSPSYTVLYTVDAIRLENPNYYKTVMKVVNQLNKDGKVDEVQRAYYCRFVKGELSFFNPDDILNMFYLDSVMSIGSATMCDLGIDFGGQTVSRTVLTVTSMGDDGHVNRLWHKVYEVGKDDLLIEDIENLVLPNFNIQRMIPDECPQGDFMIRKMVDKGWDIHPMNFRTDKVKKYGAFRSALHKGLIHSYGDDELQTEMLALEFNNGDRQSLINHAPGYTDDLIDSFIMSCYFFVQDESKFEIIDFDGEDDKCPKCKSKKLERNELKGNSISFKCFECRNEWFKEVEVDDYEW